MSEQIRKEFEAWYSQRWPGRSANVAMHSALEADAWEIWQAAQGASLIRVDGIGELGIRLPMKVDGVTALENGVLGVVVQLPKQIGEMKCWIHDCKTVEQCADTGCAQRRATQPQAPQGGVPNGFKLVPIDATLDMSIAFAEQFYIKARCIDDDDISDWWKAMLDAAPTETPEAGK